MQFFVVLMGAAYTACGFCCAYEYSEYPCKIPGKRLLLKESNVWKECLIHPVFRWTII